MERRKTRRVCTGNAPAVLKVCTYYVLLLSIILLLMAEHQHLVTVPLLVLLLLWCTRASFPLRPTMTNRQFTAAETWVWFSGAAVSVFVALTIARLKEASGVLQFLHASGVGAGCWASMFLACRDCRLICKSEGNGESKTK
jgi:hypothetical protein